MKRSEWKDFIMVFLILFLSPSTFMFGTNENSTFTRIPTFFLAVMLLYLLFKTNNYNSRIMKKLSSYLIGVVILSVLTMLFYLDFRGGYLVNVVYFIIAFLFVLYCPLKTFVVNYERVIFVITLYSLCVMFFYSIVGVLHLPSITNSVGFVHYNAFLCTLPAYDSSLYGRLYGPFREPGVFQLFLNIALVFHIYIEKRINYLRGFIYITAILLTFSTTGYIVLFGVLLAWLLSGYRTKRSQKYYLLLLVSAFLLLVFNTDFFASDGIVFVKFSAEGRDSGSMVSRVASIMGNIDVFFHNPILGVGYTRMDEMFRNYCTLHFGVGSGASNTNTILYQFASLGLFYGLLWVIPFYRFFSNLGLTNVTSHILAIFMMLAFMGENMMENIIVYIFIGYGVVYSNKKLLPESR